MRACWRGRPDGPDGRAASHATFMAAGISVGGVVSLALLVRSRLVAHTRMPGACVGTCPAFLLCLLCAQKKSGGGGGAGAGSKSGASAAAAPAAPKALKEIPAAPADPGFAKPNFDGGGSEAEYKVYMQRRLEYETYENRILKRNMIVQAHIDRGCSCGGRGGPAGSGAPPCDKLGA